jgi:hypothetical protein
MLAISVYAVVLGTWLARSNQQRLAVAALREYSHCEIGYNFDVPPDCRRQTTPAGSTYRAGWLENTFGMDAVHNVVDVTIPTSRLREAMDHLKGLPALRQVLIWSDKTEDGSDVTLEQGFQMLQDVLPHVKRSEAVPCLMTVTRNPVVG